MKESTTIGCDSATWQRFDFARHERTKMLRSFDVAQVYRS
jgi:hypothetical protein